MNQRDIGKKMLYAAKSEFYANRIKDQARNPNTLLGNTAVPISTVAKNIGVFFDDTLRMKNHLQHNYRMAYFDIHCIGRI